MLSKARILAHKEDFERRRVFLQVELIEPNMKELEGILSLSELRMDIDKWKEPRSMNANRYFHLLSDKLADARRMSKSEMKNYLLYEYGQKQRDDDGYLICIKTNAPRETLMQSKDFHVWDAKAAPDGTPMYVLLRHSSDFDSREMSILIDGVVQECKAQGIQTLTPREIAELKERWGVDG